MVCLFAQALPSSGDFWGRCRPLQDQNPAITLPRDGISSRIAEIGLSALAIRSDALCQQCASSLSVITGLCKPFKEE
jgi:hypothetical protein